MVELDMFCEDEVQPALGTVEVQAICNAVLKERSITRPCMVSLSFVTDATIAELNLEWRGFDKPTDVLSFETERPDDPDLSADEPAELGDIVLAPAYIEAQARMFNTTPADETRLLLVHGLLHLLGYDHMEEHDARLMQRIEDKILALLPSDNTLTQVVLTRHREDAE